MMNEHLLHWLVASLLKAVLNLAAFYVAMRLAFLWLSGWATEWVRPLDAGGRSACPRCGRTSGQER
jgi:hypothetical protein